MGLKLAGILAVLMMCGGAVFAWYYNDTQERLAILNENNAKLNVAIETSEQAVQSLQQDYVRVSEELTTVNAEFQAAREQNRVLQDKLSRHDIGFLATQKPTLIERTINRATIKAGRCFELLSGADLTENEKNATSANAFNSECPWLWPGASAN